MNDSNDYYVIKKTNEVVEACFYVKNSTNDPLWRDHSSLNTSLPFLLTQLFVVLLLDRLLLFLLRPIRQPPIVAHIICGVVLGPTMFAETEFSMKYIFPHKTTMVLETFANLALTYYMFLIGLEMDFSLILQSGAQVISVTAAGIMFPLLLGFGLYFMAIKDSEDFDRRGSLFWAIALTSTNFPDLTRILADLKLLRTNIGRIAMSSAILSDLFSWFLLIIAISIFNGQKYKTILSTVVFVLICLFALRPAIAWMINRASKGEVISDTTVWFIMAGILLFGLTTDACGSNSIVGAFMFGVILPKDETVRNKVVEKLNYFVTGILMPLFFYINGLRSDIPYMFKKTSLIMVVIVVVCSWAAKVVSVSLVSLHYKMSARDSLILGLLMNTKGVLALIILNTGRNIGALNQQTFPLMILVLLVMSCLIEPIISLVNKPSRKILKNLNRSIKGSAPDTELRILACVHSMRNVMGTLSLLKLSHGTNESPLSVFGTHLIELSKRASTAMLIVHNDGNQDEGGRFNRAKTETTNIIQAFENFEKANDDRAVTVYTMSVISPYATMHVDICSLAEDKCVNLIVLPFHKEVKADGHMGTANSNYANVNNNVLMSTPCSVAILVDRGISSKVFDSQDKSSGNYIRQIAMLYVGGPDDREALAYAYRMAGHPNVNLTVARFLPGQHATDPNLQSNASINREKLIDDENIEDFKSKVANNSGIHFTEMTVHNGEETIAGIRTLGDNVFDLYVVGRRQGEFRSPVTEGLSDWGTCPELGALGDTLVSSNFALNASVVVVQHYISTDVIPEMSDNVPTCTLGIGTKQGVQRCDF
ncbi:cation/H+ exchanger 23 [Hibiscus trionum]|uniref:Cation/H+ exchanger 23 n=1 Tax=Hibiscus trionum TaxID=183268 RepID=A0A9W7J1T1_HIBTR|nr:cation/H+ exchanger 23 [Hibiscus trionum]